MNIIDILLILIILFSVWGGFHKGFIAGALEFFGWVSTLYLVFLIYPYLAKLLEKNTSSPGITAYGIIFLLSIVLIRSLVDLLINSVLNTIPSKFSRHKLNMILGSIPGLANGFVYAILVAAFLFMVPFTEEISQKTAESKLANHLSNALDSLERKLPFGFDSVQVSLTRMKMESGHSDFIKLDFKVQDPTVRPDLEAQMLILVNEERAKKGLKALKSDPEMTVVARKHSKDMFARGFFSHYTPEKKSPFDRMNEEHVSYLTAGENLSLAPTLAMAHRGLMQSPGHRANILRPAFGRLGIGILDGGRYGIMVTQNFRN